MAQFKCKKTCQGRDPRGERRKSFGFSNLLKSFLLFLCLILVLAKPCISMEKEFSRGEYFNFCKQPKTQRRARERFPLNCGQTKPKTALDEPEIRYIRRIQLSTYTTHLFSVFFLIFFDFSIPASLSMFLCAPHLNQMAANITTPPTNLNEDFSNPVCQTENEFS